MKSIFSQAKEFMGVETSKPLAEGMAVVFVWYAKSKHRVFIDIGAAVSAFQVHLYLATGVMPSRQKLVGFEGGSGPSAALQPNADLATMNVRDGMELRLTQL